MHWNQIHNYQLHKCVFSSKYVFLFLLDVSSCSWLTEKSSTSLTVLWMDTLHTSPFSSLKSWFLLHSDVFNKSVFIKHVYHFRRPSALGEKVLCHIFLFFFSLFLWYRKVCNFSFKASWFSCWFKFTLFSFLCSLPVTCKASSVHFDNYFSSLPCFI